MDRDASYYQAKKRNETEWEEAPEPRRRSERRRLDSMVSVRFSAEEAKHVRAEADAAGLSLSRFIREAALQPPSRRFVSSHFEATSTSYSPAGESGSSPVVFSDPEQVKPTTAPAA